MTKILCALFGHDNHIAVTWNGENDVTVVWYCKKCGKRKDARYKRPHNWDELPI